MYGQEGSNGNMRDPWGGKNVLCPDLSDSSALVVILCYNFERCFHGGKLGKGYTESVFLTTACGSKMISKRFMKKKNQGKP